MGNSLCCSGCHKNMASFANSLRMFTKELDILGTKLRNMFAIPRKLLTSLTVVGGCKSIMAWHFSCAGLYPFSPPTVMPAKVTDCPNWTFLLEILILYCLHLSNSFSNFLRTSSSVLPSNNKSSTSSHLQQAH